MHVYYALVVGLDKPAIPGRGCFKLFSSRQQGTCTIFLAHDPALHTHNETYMYMNVHVRPTGHVCGKAVQVWGGRRGGKELVESPCN